MTSNTTEPAAKTSAETIKELQAALKRRQQAAAEEALREPEVPPMAAVSVSLVGSRGQGAAMILDEPVWEVLSERFGAAWSILNVDGRAYVYTARRDAIEAAEGVASKTNVLLARLLLWLRDGVAPGAVFHQNGNPLDLRLRNLTKRKRDVARLQAPAPVIRVAPYVDAEDTVGA